MLTGVDQPLDGAGVLLEHVLQIWHRPMPAILGESAFGIELRDGGRIHGVAVGVDHQPTASRITSGSNRRHLNSPEIDGTRNARLRRRYAFDTDYAAGQTSGFERNGNASVPLLHPPLAHFYDEHQSSHGLRATISHQT